jgi:hypothetical protein
MIEIAPKEYWVMCGYDEINFCLFVLSIDGITGWRLPTDKESQEWICERIYHDFIYYYENWVVEDLGYDFRKTETYLLVPVRDLKDD